MSILELMAAPFAECMVLVGIHTYLGIHVLRRRVIFVDLALAQVAALGTMVGFLFGILPETPAALIVSMVFTFIGAALFALTRIRSERVPQEAVIGLVYAITAAVAVLVVEKTQGGEHLKEILVGCILWVTWRDVGTAAAAYTLVGVVHYIFRKQFFLISENPELAYKKGMNVRAWDFFFYVTFGFVIAFSTRVAGVLLVFVFLVAPAIMAFMITNRLRTQLIIGWVMGTVVTVSGLYLSYALDLPSGPSVVAFYGVALGAGALVIFVARAANRLKALGLVGTGLAAAGLATLLFVGGANWLSGTWLAVSSEVQAVEQAMARSAAAQPAKKTAALPGPAQAGTEGARRCQAFRALPDPQAKLDYIQKLSGKCRRGSIRLLHIILSAPATPVFFRAEGSALLLKLAGDDFDYDPDLDPAQNSAALEKLKAHQEGLPRGGGVECDLDC